jgi:hypothetical protein
MIHIISTLFTIKKVFIVLLIAGLVFVHVNKGYAIPYLHNNSFTDTSKTFSSPKSTNPSIKGFIFNIVLTWLHFSIAAEYPIKNNYTFQITYNYSNYVMFSSESDHRKEVNTWNSIMPEVRYYIINNKKKIISTSYLFAFPRISINRNNDLLPLHTEIQYGGGLGIGRKFFTGKHFYFDISIGCYYRNTITKYKSEYRNYQGLLPKMSLHLCYMFNKK